MDTHTIQIITPHDVDGMIYEDPNQFTAMVRYQCALANLQNELVGLLQNTWECDGDPVYTAQKWVEALEQAQGHADDFLLLCKSPEMAILRPGPGE